MSGSRLFDILRLVGGGVCHQLPDRSLHVAGTSLPLCARCTGTYLGAAAAVVTILLLRRERASLLPSWPILSLFAASFLAWGIDGLNSYLTLVPGAPHLYEPTNALRLLTGTLQGLALTLVIWPVAAFTLWRNPRRDRLIHAGELGLCASGALAVAALSIRGVVAALAAAGVLSVLGLVALFVLLNLMVLAVALHRDGTLDGARHLLPLLGLSALAAAAELGGLSLLRHCLLGF
ncbi:MAG: DUF2085 domain-containing protein [Anaerolineae bacterium]|nr:DUF2085 domain-containing protein [Anaerolineae bacterium]